MWTALEKESKLQINHKSLSGKSWQPTSLSLPATSHLKNGFFMWRTIDEEHTPLHIITVFAEKVSVYSYYYWSLGAGEWHTPVEYWICCCSALRARILSDEKTEVSPRRDPKVEDFCGLWSGRFKTAGEKKIITKNSALCLWYILHRVQRGLQSYKKPIVSTYVCVYK